MEKIKYVNDFGIKPTNTFISAGTDFYIPYIETNEQANYAIKAFEKSYNVSIDVQAEIMNDIKRNINETSMLSHPVSDLTAINIMHLYLATQSYKIEECKMQHGNYTKHYYEDLMYFINNYLVWTPSKNEGADEIPGVKLQWGDTLFINSGIKIALNPNDAGLYVNKSGMGNKGWDVRACLVDEDYSGYVHLSCAFTKHTHNTKLGTVYCGDKLTQMMIVTVKHYEWETVSNDEYNDIMKDSKRGDKAFGHSDIKH